VREWAGGILPPECEEDEMEGSTKTKKRWVEKRKQTYFNQAHRRVICELVDGGICLGGFSIRGRGGGHGCPSEKN